MPADAKQSLGRGTAGNVEQVCNGRPADAPTRPRGSNGHWLQQLWPMAGIAVVAATVVFVYRAFLVAPWRTDLEARTFAVRGVTSRPVATADGLMRWVASSPDGVWEPVTRASAALEVAVFGRDHDKCRITNVLLHLLVALLLFVVIREIGTSSALAAGVAAVFAVHPIAVEAVAWLPGRSELLGAVLALAALVLYLNFARRRGKVALYTSVLLSLCASFATPTLVALPFGFLLVELSAPSNVTHGHQTAGFRLAFGSGVRESGFWFVVGALVVAVAVGAEIKDGRVAFALAPELPYRLAEIPIVCGAQICRAVLPHSGPWQLPGSPIAVWTVAGGSLALVLGLSLLAWRRQRYSPLVCGAWLFFVVTAFSVAGRVAMRAESPFGSFYIPLIGLVTAGVLIVSKALPSGSMRDALFPLLVAANVVILARMAHTDVATCEDRWTDFVAGVRQSEPASFDAFVRDDGTACSDERWVDAMRTIDATLTGVDDEATLPLQRANALQQLNCTGAASAQYRMALQIDENNFTAHYNLGLLLVLKGQQAEAERHFWRALEINPYHAVAYVGIGKICDERGEHFQAREYLRRALELDPSLQRQHTQGTDRMFPGDHLDDTIARLERSLDHSPNSADAAALDVAPTLRAAPQVLASGSN
jgi:tetratricopeptide (TPR) repeat protein